MKTKMISDLSNLHWIFLHMAYMCIQIFCGSAHCLKVLTHDLEKMYNALQNVKNSTMKLIANMHSAVKWRAE